jgi:hypothetical protein
MRNSGIFTEQKAIGRQIVLTTAADVRIAQAIADHRLFDESQSRISK